MKKQKKEVLMWVHPDFKRELKISSAECDKRMKDFSKELADELREKRTQQKRKMFNNGFI